MDPPQADQDKETDRKTKKTSPGGFVETDAIVQAKVDHHQCSRKGKDTIADGYYSTAVVEEFHMLKLP